LTRWIPLGLLAALLTSGGVAAQDECPPARLTAFSVQQYPGQMRNGLVTGPHVGVAVAVGIDRAGAPLVPLGTVVWIEGLGERTVMDTGHGGAGWYDVLVATTAEARQFGRQTRAVCR
jgi:3D (Asp-Asp-Asp) domain-containing protein